MVVLIMLLLNLLRPARNIMRIGILVIIALCYFSSVKTLLFSMEGHDRNMQRLPNIRQVVDLTGNEAQQFYYAQVASYPQSPYFTQGAFGQPIMQQQAPTYPIQQPVYPSAQQPLPQQQLPQAQPAAKRKRVTETAKPKPKPRPQKTTQEARGFQLHVDLNTESFDYSLERNFCFGPSLMQELMRDNPEQVRIALNTGKIKHTAYNSLGEAIIHIAARDGAINIVRLLIHDYRVPLDQPDEKGRTPLCHALAAFISPATNRLREGARSIIFYLLSLGASLKEISQEWIQTHRECLITVLMRAAVTNDVDVIKLLSELIEDFKEVISQAFVRAARHGSVETLEFLYSLSGDLLEEERDSMLEQALSAARVESRESALQWLEEHTTHLRTRTIQSITEQAPLPQPDLSGALSDTFYRHL